LTGHVTRIGERRDAYRFWWGNLRKRDRWKDPGVDGRIVLRRIFRKWNWGSRMDWIDLAQDRYRWRTLVKGVMNFRGY
jgi:hypothetical protein